MTFLITRYQLAKISTRKDLERLSRLGTVYGIRRLSMEGQHLTVEYDASRIREAEVLAAVRSLGIAVVPLEPIPAGAVDYSGEFKDFAWPTTGLSPVNVKHK